MIARLIKLTRNLNVHAEETCDELQRKKYGGDDGEPASQVDILHVKFGYAWVNAGF